MPNEEISKVMEMFENIQDLDLPSKSPRKKKAKLFSGNEHIVEVGM